MIRCFLVAGVLAATLSAAQAQDVAGTYSLSGSDNLGNAVDGWLRIAADGTIERRVQIRDKVLHTSHATTRSVIRSGGTQRIVFSSKGEATGLTGSLGEPVDSAGKAQQLTVTCGPDRVQVEFARGTYSSSEEGARVEQLYDLQQLYDDHPARAEIKIELEVDNRSPKAPAYSEALRYVREGDTSQETRTYEQLQVNGKRIVREGAEQTLTREGEVWVPKRDKTTRRVDSSSLVKSTYKPMGVTSLVSKQPVALGERWTLPLDSTVRLLNLQGDPESGTVEGQLLGVDEVDGGLRYRLELRIDLTLDLPQLKFSDAGRVQVRIRVSQSPALHTVGSRVRITGTQSSGPFEQVIDNTLVVTNLADR